MEIAEILFFQANNRNALPNKGKNNENSASWIHLKIVHDFAQSFTQKVTFQP